MKMKMIKCYRAHPNATEATASSVFFSRALSGIDPGLPETHSFEDRLKK
jgi:hypothetical protein